MRACVRLACAYMLVQFCFVYVRRACVCQCASARRVCQRERGVWTRGDGGAWGRRGGSAEAGRLGHACAVTVTGIYNRSDVRATAIPFHTLLGLPPVLTRLGAKQWTPTD